MALPLGRLTQSESRLRLDSVSDWVRAWQDHKGPGQIEWQEKRWSVLGRQILPMRLLLPSADDVAVWTGEDRRWAAARSRFTSLVERWPALATVLPKHFDVLADYSEQDFERLVRVLIWFDANPQSHLLPRQLPVQGLDSKWLEARRGLVADFVGSIRPCDMRGRGFFEVSGLRPLPNLVRINILDAALRERVGGIRDLAAPIDDLAQLDLPARCLFVVENLQTGLAFDDLKSTVVVMGLGYGIDALQKLRFADQAAIFYWGDFDTHGFAILSRARGFFPHLKSLMMDESTLLRYRDLWGEEPTQHAGESLPNLSEAELATYRDLKQHRWRFSVRLEQERISWPEAWSKIKEAHSMVIADRTTSWESNLFGKPQMASMTSR